MKENDDMDMRRLGLAACFGAAASGCVRPAAHSSRTSRVHAASPGGAPSPATAAPREPPPAPGTPRDVSFPPVTTRTLSNGLQVNVIEYHALPVLYVRLVVRAGSATDPADRAGLGHFVAQMLKEGTRSRSSARIAEDVEFLGGDLHAGNDPDVAWITFQSLKDQADQALELVADLASNATFPEAEIEKLRSREIDRLNLALANPNFLASREFYRALYGPHPYASVDATPASVRAITRAECERYYRERYTARNAFLVVAGDVDPDEFLARAESTLGRLRAGERRDVAFPPIAPGQAPRVVVVDRDTSVQSVVVLGNEAMRRNDPDYVKFLVLNQVLGGSAASRLFIELRERRSLTYGAYSGVPDAVDLGAFRARASVRTEVTGDALDAFFAELRRIVAEPPTADEVANAKRYLVDSFPLVIETPGNLAEMVADLRVYDLPDDYWRTYRSAIERVTAEDAFAAARRIIHPDRFVVVLVGRAADVVPHAARYGDVTVVDAEGREVRRVPRAAN